MKELQKVIQENSANLKNQKGQKASELLDAVRGGSSDDDGIFFKTTWDRR
ncbi:hypothetical protein [Xenorhabdus griffiniae]|uniref:Uncharacterized protein n=1 Tax=Xenorhabdus griffiniae TaxID=351672 RepID=A0ABY9XER2_9GAMM|nr:hypothetical protein [Xenorhabdus griffiniae]MBD1226019.1 hypothetical protein [Xenorhabdus griffiniae]MBE8585863.1 hypothetical protein [Xenorhabdus griffiniae]WMV71410.1 hypothetical protein QL128_14700 [Xenorhabdus griffiniae]WNH01086.1 hypothetical protein QL112_014705 [Xenorhabdus griffiniae]